MRVYIGPFYHWFTPWRWLRKRAIANKTGWRRDEIDDWFDTSRWVCAFLWIERFVDKRTKRKINVKIDPWDVWNLDHTLASIIAPGLKLFKEKKHGAQSTDDEDVPEYLRSTAPPVNPDDINNCHAGNNYVAKWDWILGEMIYAMEQEARSEWEECPPEYDRTDLPAYRAARTARISNGHRLFGKYFQALWD